VKSDEQYNAAMESGYESLLALPGVGKSMADALYDKGFFSSEEISNALVEDIIQVKGIGEGNAEKLIEAAIHIVSNTENVEKTVETEAGKESMDNKEITDPKEPERMEEKSLNETGSSENDFSSVDVEE